MELDAIDKLAAKAFEGYIVRKDLVRKFKGQYPVPTYVAEFLLGRYCSSIDEKEIEEGLQIVQRQLGCARGGGLHYKPFCDFGGWKPVVFLRNPPGAPAKIFKPRPVPKVGIRKERLADGNLLFCLAAHGIG